MQQWFEQEKSEILSETPVEKLHKIHKKFKKTEMPSIVKTFSVEAETVTGQHIFVSGNCSTLGNWNVNDAFMLTNTNVKCVKDNRTYHTWSGKVNLPTDKQILFRYFVGYVIESDDEYVKEKQTFVHSWESHHEPRTVQFSDDNQLSCNNSKVPCDLYGFNNGKQKISIGFLTTECSVQFKLYDNPIIFWASKLQSRINSVSIKMTPVPLTNLSANDGDISPDADSFLLDDSNSTAADDIQKHCGWPIVEYVEIPGNHKFQRQNQFGTNIKENHFQLFQTKIHNFGYVGFLFDIYIHKEDSKEPPYHAGFTYILPGNMKYSNGVIISPITSVRHKPIGELKIDYLIIKPTKDIICNLERIKTTDWESSYVPLDIGHRGSGSSFNQIASDCSHIRENTIASLKEAGNKGADFVEFDVQLTKDLVPIIFHDFFVAMATKSKTDILSDNVEMVKIPLKDFSFEQLQKLKIYHVKEPYSLPESHFLNDTRNDYQPFPKLEKAFKDVDVNIGFNVELKWTMKLQDGTYELDNPFDMNLFVDTILQTTFQYAGSRSIVFSCFHPDICTMIKMKQNRYPVLFLTQGITERYPPYEDPRCHTIETAVYHSACHDFLGVNVHSEDLLRDHTQIKMVKEAGLALFCWGNDNNCKEVVINFKRLGVNAVIYDKLDKDDLLKKKQACSNANSDVFIVDNYCDQNGILISKNQSLKENPHLREDNDRAGDNNRYFMDVGKASFQNQCSSTETLWDENGSLINDPKSPSKKQRLGSNDQMSKNDSNLSISKKLKSGDHH